MLNYPQKLDSSLIKFEKVNNLILNIYSCEKKLKVPIRISLLIDGVFTPFLESIKDVPITQENVQEYTKDLLDLNHNNRLVNLFLYSNHYSLKTNLHRLVSKQVSPKETHNYIFYCCYRCLSSCKSALKRFPIRFHRRTPETNEADLAPLVLNIVKIRMKLRKIRHVVPWE